MRVTAEGVETSEQLKRLLANGCSEMQGFYMSHPLMTTDFRTLLSGVETGSLGRNPP